MDALLQDLRYAARRLARSRGFTVLAVLTLALGIGANSAIFSVVNAVLLRPLPFADPALLDQVHSTKEGIGHVPVSGPDFLQMREESRAYQDLAAFTLSFPNLTREGEPVRLNGTVVSASFFDVLGVQPTLGRTFATNENEPGRNRVAVLAHSFWQQRFGGDPEILGRAILLDGESYDVVGVMPPEFDYPDDRELWTPLEYGQTFSDDANRMGHFLSVVGRRKPGTTTAEGAADIASIAGRIGTSFPDLKAGFGGTAVSLPEQLIGDVRTPLMILLGAVGFVLLIACANVANLLLARAVAREGEIAVRTALGAERGRLVRQLLTESVLLGVLGGAAGLLLSVWGTAWLLRLQPAGIPRLDEVGVDGTVVGFTFGIAILTGLIFGAVPAYHASRADLAGAMREGGRGAAGNRGATRMRAGLVVIETALAVMLLSGAGLLIRSFAEISAVDPGFRTESTLAFDLSLPTAAYPVDEQVIAFYRTLEERLRDVPGVLSVGASSSLPMSGFGQNSPMRVDGRGEARPGDDDIVTVRTVTSALLPVLGVPVLRGRGFTASDRSESPRVALVTEAAAARYFPGEDPIGQRITISSPSAPQWAEVVGIVGDVRAADLTAEVDPGIYLLHSQRPSRQMSLAVRTGSDPALLLPTLSGALQELDPDLPIFNVRTLEQVVGRSISQPRFYMLLLSIFAMTAIVLSAIGIFGVMSYMVVQRTREIGIRMALGAHRASVLQRVVGGAVVLALAGVAVGLLGAIAGSRLLSALLYGVSPTDPATLGSVAVILTAVACLASYFPARRAVRVDPMVALRTE